MKPVFPTLLPQPWPVPVGPTALGGTFTAATGAWPTANTALYHPLFIPFRVRLASISIDCVATGSGTYDIAIIDAAGTTRMVSRGSTSLTTGIVTWTLDTPIFLQSGLRYFIGMSCSTTSATFTRFAPAVNSMRGYGYAQQATAHPIPANPTPATQTSAYAMLFALTFVT